MQRRFAPRAMALAAIPFVSLRGQQPGEPLRPPVAPSGRLTAACAGQRIDDIVIYSAAPSVANLQRVPVLARIARSMHATTRTELIRRFLLLDETQPCSELRRAESERILRAQPFIADADVFVIPNDHGGVDLEVRTSDEVSLVIGGSVRARRPNVSFLLLGNANLAGQGVFVSGAWRDGDRLARRVYRAPGRSSVPRAHLGVLVGSRACDARRFASHRGSAAVSHGSAARRVARADGDEEGLHRAAHAERGHAHSRERAKILRRRRHRSRRDHRAG